MKAPILVPEPLLRYHEGAFARLDRIPPVLLMTGPSGIGKREMSCHLAGRILGDSWIDFTEITPEEDSDTLKVDQFRKLKASAGFSGGFGSSGKRVILVADAERMTNQAANSLLKLLEEPPRGWHFILTASDPTLLLPTIVSRCQRIRLKPLSRTVLLELLGQASGAGAPERLAECARLAQGSWARARALAEDDAWQKRQELFRFLENPKPGLNALVDASAAEPRAFSLMLDLLEGMTADLIACSLAPEGAQPRELPKELTMHARAVVRRRGVEGARKFWLDRAERVAEARREATAPLNRKLLAQDVLLPWLEASGEGPA